MRKNRSINKRPKGISHPLYRVPLIPTPLHSSTERKHYKELSHLPYDSCCCTVSAVASLPRPYAFRADKRNVGFSKTPDKVPLTLPLSSRFPHTYFTPALLPPLYGCALPWRTRGNLCATNKGTDKLLECSQTSEQAGRNG